VTITRTPTRATGGVTPAELERMYAIRDKWIRIAFATLDSVSPDNDDKIRDAIERLYRAANIAKPRVIIVDSPYIMALAYRKALEMLSQLKSDATGREWGHVYQGGNMWAGFLAYAEALRDVIGLTGLDCWEKYQAWEDAAKCSGFRVMHEKFCIVSRFPVELHVGEKKLPHNDNGPSHRWRDGFEIYTLNGVRVRKEVVTTPPELMTRDFLMKYFIVEQNVDVRAQILKKLGVELFLSRMGGTLIASEPPVYELYSLDLGGETRAAKYLKMKNPSVDLWHVEPVDDACTTIDEALHSRKPHRLREIKVRDNGADWYQQGDVCIWPQNAKAIKPRPKILT